MTGVQTCALPICFPVTIGKVGIGTSAPSNTLSVHASNPTRGLIAKLQNDSTSSQTGSQLWFNQAAIANWVIGQPAGADAFAFWSGRADNADGTERMRLTSTGVGIGTASPGGAFLLDVAGAARFTGGNGYVSFGDNGYIRTDATNELRFQGGTAGTSFWKSNSSSESVRIDDSGRLLVGTSTSRGG